MASSSLLTVEVGSSLSVLFGEAYGSQDLKLLEVEDSILKEILQSGAVIRGSPSDEAVLCTSSSTFAIKFVSSSNTIFLIPPSQNEADPMNAAIASAVASSQGHLELVHISPRLDRLKELLSERPLTDDTEAFTAENEDVEGLYTFDDLLNLVQASPDELKAGLKALAAIEVGNHWRLVDDKFMQCLLEVIILNSLQHDWPLYALQEPVVLSVLGKDGYSPEIVRHCLRTYGLPANSSARVDTDDEEMMNEDDQVEIWALNENQVSLHYAKQLLQAVSKWRLEDFVEAWQQNVPAEISTDLEILRGEALVEKLGSESWLHQFSVSSLPTKPAERFAMLFRERPRWEWHDLEPYVRDLQAPGQSVEALLLKFTRKIQPTADSAPVFTARR